MTCFICSCFLDTFKKSSKHDKISSVLFRFKSSFIIFESLLDKLFFSQSLKTHSQEKQNISKASESSIISLIKIRKSDFSHHKKSEDTDMINLSEHAAKEFKASSSLKTIKNKKLSSKSSSSSIFFLSTFMKCFNKKLLFVNLCEFFFIRLIYKVMKSV